MPKSLFFYSFLFLSRFIFSACLPLASQAADALDDMVEDALDLPDSDEESEAEEAVDEADADRERSTRELYSLFVTCLAANPHVTTAITRRRFAFADLLERCHELTGPERAAADVRGRTGGTGLAPESDKAAEAAAAQAETDRGGGGGGGAELAGGLARPPPVTGPGSAAWRKKSPVPGVVTVDWGMLAGRFVTYLGAHNYDRSGVEAATVTFFALRSRFVSRYVSRGAFS